MDSLETENVEPSGRDPVLTGIAEPLGTPLPKSEGEKSPSLEVSCSPPPACQALELTGAADVRSAHIPYILNGELYEIQTQEGENVTVKCCHCPPDRVYRGSVRSTGNFHMHIKRRHPYLLSKLHDMKVSALLERRDRFVKNRKVTHRSRHSDSAKRRRDGRRAKATAPICPTTAVTEAYPRELSLLHTHKLKIHTAFQRHLLHQQQQKQQQQQQQEQQQQEEKQNHKQKDHKERQQQQQQPHQQEQQPPQPHSAHQQTMRNWNDATSFSALANGVLSSTRSACGESFEEPINYSHKATTQVTGQRIGSDETRLLNLSTESISMKRADSGEPFGHYQRHHALTHMFSAPPTSVTTEAATFHGFYENQGYERATTSAGITPSASTVSSLGSLLSLEQQSTIASQPSPLGVVKNEQMTPGDQAIDLSKQVSSTSGLGSSETLSGGGDSGTSAAATSFNTATNRSVPHALSSHFRSFHEDVLLMMQASLHSIHREMQARNQIETNRMYLDIAKFKYLYPNFNFHY